MPATVQQLSFPLEGRDPSHLKRSEIIEAVKTAPKISPFLGGTSIARITASIIVKYGSHVCLHEARNMQYVSQHTDIRVPAVLDAWEVEDQLLHEGSPTGYIMMQYIDGQRVSGIWDTLDLESRRSILSQLYQNIQTLHALKMENPGPVGGGTSEGSFFTDYGAGPFKSKEDMEDWFNNRLLVCHDFGHAKQTPPGWFSGRFNKLVMCHLDIHPRNLILDCEGKLWVLDWAFSGAYPPYFETANLIWRDSCDVTSGLIALMVGETRPEEIDKLIGLGFALTTGAYCQPRIRGQLVI